MRGRDPRAAGYISGLSRYILVAVIIRSRRGIKLTREPPPDSLFELLSPDGFSRGQFIRPTIVDIKTNVGVAFLYPFFFYSLSTGWTKPRYSHAAAFGVKCAADGTVAVSTFATGGLFGTIALLCTVHFYPPSFGCRKGRISTDRHRETQRVGRAREW